MWMARFLDLPEQIDRLELAKIVIAAGLLLSIIAISVFQIQILNPPKIKKLAVIALSRPYVDEEAVLRVAVVNEEGAIVENRDDLIEVSIMTKGISLIRAEDDSDMAWSRKLQIRLRNGAAEVLFKGLDDEPSTIITRQIDGPTPLDENRVTFIPHPR